MSLSWQRDVNNVQPSTPTSPLSNDPLTRRGHVVVDRVGDSRGVGAYCIRPYPGPAVLPRELHGPADPLTRPGTVNCGRCRCRGPTGSAGGPPASVAAARVGGAPPMRAGRPRSQYCWLHPRRAGRPRSQYFWAPTKKPFHQPEPALAAAVRATHADSEDMRVAALVPEASILVTNHYPWVRGGTGDGDGAGAVGQGDARAVRGVAQQRDEVAQRRGDGVAVDLLLAPR